MMGKREVKVTWLLFCRTENEDRNERNERNVQLLLEYC